METGDEVKKRKKDGWIEVWTTFEALGISAEAVRSALNEHIAKLEQSKELFIFEKSESDVTKTQNPFPKLKHITEAYSQIVSLKMMVKNVYTLVTMVVLYGPSSVEIIEPVKMEIKIDELQNIANALAGFMHRFASVGAGGIVISPKGK